MAKSLILAHTQQGVILGKEFWMLDQASKRKIAMDSMEDSTLRMKSHLRIQDVDREVVVRTISESVSING